MKALEQIPGMSTALFSILGPGKHIREHRGYYNGFLRYHLGLVVPGPVGACRIRVADQVRCWEEGKSLIFDDTNRHEAWNETAQDRVVLYVDVLRPVLFPMSLINRIFIAVISKPFVREGQKKIRDWEAKLPQTPDGPHSPQGGKEPL
jgi:beta-hydroxylase